MVHFSVYLIPKWLSIISVGYDDRRMVLDGEFTYESENQRALPFNVKINEISEEMKVYSGSTSKCHKQILTSVLAAAHFISHKFPCSKLRAGECCRNWWKHIVCKVLLHVSVGWSFDQLLENFTHEFLEPDPPKKLLSVLSKILLRIKYDYIWAIFIVKIIWK